MLQCFKTNHKIVGNSNLANIWRCILSNYIYFQILNSSYAYNKILNIFVSNENILTFYLSHRSITLSDPLPQNRRMQELYMEDIRQHERFTPNYKLTAQLEGNVDKWTDVRSRLRYHKTVANIQNI